MLGLSPGGANAVHTCPVGREPVLSVAVPVMSLAGAGSYVDK